MSPDWWRDCRDGIEKCSSPTGDGNCNLYSFKVFSGLKLRNVVPRQGTEITTALRLSFFKLKLRNVVPRQGTEKEAIPLPRLSSLIEKCSSPTGDGNEKTLAIQLSRCND